MVKEPLLTTGELGKALSLTRRTITRYYKNGMPAEIDYPRRYLLSSVKLWLKNQNKRRR